MARQVRVGVDEAGHQHAAARRPQRVVGVGAAIAPAGPDVRDVRAHHAHGGVLEHGRVLAAGHHRAGTDDHAASARRIEPARLRRARRRPRGPGSSVVHCAVAIEHAPRHHGEPHVARRARRAPAWRTGRARPSGARCGAGASTTITSACLPASSEPIVVGPAERARAVAGRERHHLARGQWIGRVAARARCPTPGSSRGRCRAGCCTPRRRSRGRSGCPARATRARARAPSRA